MKRFELVGLNVVTVGGIGISLPLIGFAFSVIWSLLFAFDVSTSTHCQVFNFLPTVSAAIRLTPQAYVWRACIFLHMLPRFISLFAFKSFLESRGISPSSLLFVFHRFLARLAICGNLVEICGLLGLSVVSSTEIAEAHEGFFIAFMVGALVFMISNCLHNTTVIKTPREKVLAKRKLVILVVNVVSFLLAMYFYVRHNWYCETGVYSLFALFEYFVIVTNVVFHYTTGLELEDYRLCAMK